MKKNIVARAALAVWIVFWVLFLVRPLFKKGLLGEYAALSVLSGEERRGRVTGEELYGFIKFCRAALPEYSTYKIVGLEHDSLEHRRLRYYLYPDAEKEDPEFILVYKTGDFKSDGYRVFKTLDAEKYILRLSKK
ncbi:MAG: hypothetical protein PHP46_05200 [Candidatus Omnitrophica bacterium]|nr:hypothetical protein [Candidatus Omnitrophota bacterium]